MGTGQPGSNTCPWDKAASAVPLEIYGHLGCAASTQSIANEPCALNRFTCRGQQSCSELLRALIGRMTSQLHATVLLSDLPLLDGQGGLSGRRRRHLYHAISTPEEDCRLMLTGRMLLGRSLVGVPASLL